MYKSLIFVIAILGCQVDYIWEYLKSKSGRHTLMDIFFNKLEVDKSISNSDLEARKHSLNLG